MKILNYGSLNIDKIYNVNKLVTADHAKIVKGYEVMSGGKGLNQSVAMKKAGYNNIYHAGNIGKNGDFLKYTLLEYGINIDYLMKSNVDTGHAIIQVSDDGMHTILIYSGSNYNNKSSDIDEVIDHFNEGDCLLVQNEINNVAYIVKKAYEAGMRIFFNPSPVNDEVLKVDLDKIDTLIVNDVELLKISGLSTYQLALEKLKAHNLNILWTRGKTGGSYYGADGTVQEYAAYQVEELDTTAVGDVFVGYFVAEIILGRDLGTALDMSAKAAALSTKK